MNAGIDMVSLLILIFMFPEKCENTHQLDYRMLQVMLPYNTSEFVSNITYLIRNDFITMSRIDDAVSRILRVKFMMGLFEHPLADYSMTKYLGSQVRFENENSLSV